MSSAWLTSLGSCPPERWERVVGRVLCPEPGVKGERLNNAGGEDAEYSGLQYLESEDREKRPSKQREEQSAVVRKYLANLD